LTAALAARYPRVIAVEIEERLVRFLRKRFAAHPEVTIIEGDARDLDLSQVIPTGVPFSVAGNLPYFAANPIIRHLLEGYPKPQTITVMVQREVAKQIAASPGDLSLLSISVQVYAEAQLLFTVPPEAFDPPPAVYSSVVKLTLRPAALVPPERLAAFFELVSQTFRNPRKQIHNALGRGIWLPEGGAREALHEVGIDAMRRPETLDINEWLQLLQACDAVLARA
jgi:16S rRNA (adenine1518-N6/adenine1519-N6)-dimethyltransferase